MSNFTGMEVPDDALLSEVMAEHGYDPREVHHLQTFIRALSQGVPVDALLEDERYGKQNHRYLRMLIAVSEGQAAAERMPEYDETYVEGAKEEEEEEEEEEGEEEEVVEEGAESPVTQEDEEDGVLDWDAVEEQAKKDIAEEEEEVEGEADQEDQEEDEVEME
jgi:hypothetical protein